MRLSLPADAGAAKLGIFVSGLIVLVLALRFAVPVPGSGAVGTRPAAVHAGAAKAVLPNLIIPSIAPKTAQQLNAAVPLAAPTGPARPFVLASSGEDRSKALNCLTQAIYYEAGFEPTKGQEAVAQVVLNRVRHPIFPHTVCGVVFQGSELNTGCQFSFTCDGALSRGTPQAAAWTRARRVADQALSGFVLKDVGSATHYHTDFVVPWWQATVTKVAQIGAHIFYRWPGALGMPGAFNMHYAGNERTPPKPGSVTSSGGVIAAPNLTQTADGRVHAVLSVATAPEPRTPRERLLALAQQGALGAGFDPAKVQAASPAPVQAPPTRNVEAASVDSAIASHAAGE